MELSIAILAYELNPEPLVLELLSQVNKLAVETEILVYDDGSNPEHQNKLARSLKSFPSLRLILAESNSGRAKARNKLASLTQGEFVLMLDGDIGLARPDFLAHYWHHRLKNGVVIGGKELASDSSQSASELRYKYCQKREIKSASDREKQSFMGFQTTAFLTDKEVFKTVHFNENLVGYGHEDSLFGLDLQEEGFDIKHIDNPCLYPADESSAKFLLKTDEALLNLLRIEKWRPNLGHLFPLLRLKNRARLFHWAIRIKAFFLKPLLKRQLLSRSPSLLVYDLYRLMRLIELNRLNKID